MSYNEKIKRDCEEKYLRQRRKFEEKYKKILQSLRSENKEYKIRLSSLDRKISCLVEDIKVKEERIKVLSETIFQLDALYTTQKNAKKGKLIDENKLLRSENEILKKIIENNNKGYKFKKLTFFEKLRMLFL